MGLTEEEHHLLIRLNDGEGMTFKEIANFLERNMYIEIIGPHRLEVLISGFNVTVTINERAFRGRAKNCTVGGVNLLTLINDDDRIGIQYEADKDTDSGG